MRGSPFSYENAMEWSASWHATQVVEASVRSPSWGPPGPWQASQPTSTSMSSPPSAHPVGRPAPVTWQPVQAGSVSLPWRRNVAHAAECHVSFQLACSWAWHIPHVFVPRYSPGLNIFHGSPAARPATRASNPGRYGYQRSITRRWPFGLAGTTNMADGVDFTDIASRIVRSVSTITGNVMPNSATNDDISSGMREPDEIPSTLPVFSARSRWWSASISFATCRQWGHEGEK